MRCWGDFLNELDGLKSSTHRPQQSRQRYASGGSVSNRVRKLAAEGRGGDTKLARVGPRTAKMLDDVIHQGRVQRNPKTGLREYMMPGSWSASSGSGNKFTLKRKANSPPPSSSSSSSDSDSDSDNNSNHTDSDNEPLENLARYKQKLHPNPEITLQRHPQSCAFNVARYQSQFRRKKLPIPERPLGPGETESDEERDRAEKYYNQLRNQERPSSQRWRAIKRPGGVMPYNRYEQKTNPLYTGTDIRELAPAFGLTAHDAPDLSLGSFQNHAAHDNPGALEMEATGGKYKGSHVTSAWLDQHNPDIVHIGDTLGLGYSHDRRNKNKSRTPSKIQQIPFSDLNDPKGIDLYSGRYKPTKLLGFS